MEYIIAKESSIPGSQKKRIFFVIIAPPSTLLLICYELGPGNSKKIKDDI